jgi:hypothetical protein
MEKLLPAIQTKINKQKVFLRISETPSAGNEKY